MKDLELARALAQKFHAGQMYGREPYMYHLEMVTASCGRENDDRLQVIAMLHDIIEDTDVTYDMLLMMFGKDIANAVKALTKDSGDPYAMYIDRVKENELARIVKMHDTLCNLEESMVRRDTKRIMKYSKQLQLLAE